MVFLALLPDADPVKELLYTQSLHWPMQYHHQALISPQAHLEEAEEDDACSSYEGSNAVASSSMSSEDTTPPEAMTEYPQAKIDTFVDTGSVIAPPPRDSPKESEGDRLKTQAAAYNESSQGGYHILEFPISEVTIMLIVPTPGESTASTSVADQPESTHTSDNVDEMVAIVDTRVDDLPFSEITPKMADLPSLPRADSPEMGGPLVKNNANGQDESEHSALKNMASSAIPSPTKISDTDSPSTRLRHMVANSPSMILCPGVYDGLSARIALQVGFRGLLVYAVVIFKCGY